ncbi:MAG: cyclophilin-like fold protein [Dehalococcoidales bacterium]|nr:cyclophilin-like fold protein [Dehalococcoidales bacterium]
MAKQIRIKAGRVQAMAVLDDSRTAQAIWQALPIESIAELWGDEVYFSIPVHLPLENGKELVNAGDLGYWPDGDAFCIFFGPTPASRQGEIRPASAVTVFGKIIGDARAFKKVASGDDIVIEKPE